MSPVLRGVAAEALWITVLFLMCPWAAAAAAQEIRDSTDVAVPELGRRSTFEPTGAYGSRAADGPLGMLLNKAYATAQVANRDRAIFEAMHSPTHVRNALRHPIRAIERVGWGRFLRTEVLPLTWSLEDSKWIPNYAGHLVEGAVVSRRFTEWFEARGAPVPAVLGAVATLTAAVLNEMYEHPALTEESASTVADLYLFDLGGILLSNHDGFMQFLTRRLGLDVWPSQASIALPGLTLQNQGNHVVSKLPLPGEETSVFLRGGLGALFGLTRHLGDGLDLSAGIGADATRLDVDADGGETAEFRPAGGLYLDLRGSLLASALVVDTPDRMLSLNVFPGVLPGVFESLGVWVVLPRRGLPAFGFGTRRTLGLGLGIMP